MPSPETDQTQSAQASRQRLDEALHSLRDKPVRSTTLKRLRLTWEADQRVQKLPQPLQLGKGLYALLDHIATPVAPHDLLLGRILEESPDAEGEAFFRETTATWNKRAIPPWMRDGGHECFAWERLLTLGLPGLEKLARHKLRRRKAAGEKPATLDFLQGAINVYKALRYYARRYATAAQKVGLSSPATHCTAIAERAPVTFAEALQLTWLVGHVYCTMLAMNPTLTFGRMDELLLPYYRHDLLSGRLTREQAGNLIEDFYCKNNLILGRGEHQMGNGSDKDTGWLRNLTYDAPQYLVLGGRRVDGSPAANELTELFLERIVPRFENLVIVLRYTPDLPEPLWRLACEKMRANASMMVYNDENIIPAMIHAGIAPHEALTYTMHGCNWPDIPGLQRNVYTEFLKLPRLLSEALASTTDDAQGIEDIYAQFTTLARQAIKTQCERFRASRQEWDQRAPGALRVDDCFLAGPVERARSWELGGVKYANTLYAIVGIATAADSLAAVEEIVFASKRATLLELKEALRTDFAGRETLRQMCLRAPKFGQDDDRADDHAKRLLKIVLEEIDRASRPQAQDGVAAFRCLETDMRHIFFGQELGATPDGRHAGQPISENTSPMPGASRRGLTAMLNSVAKLPLNRINSGALNIRLQPTLFSGEAGLARLAALLRAYFDQGGLQAQLSFADIAELRDAQAHPEKHRDLMVRITGYSAAFVDMTVSAQDEIIRREEMGS